MLRALAFPAVAVALLLLTSCAPSPAAETPTASPSATADAPIFASEEEAVAAADEVIQKYWDATNTVYKSGGSDIEPLKALVTERRFASEQRGAQIFNDQGFRQLGDHVVNGTKFQQMYDGPDRLTLIVTVCVDYSEVRAVTSDGMEAVRKTPVPRYLHQVTLHVTQGSTAPDVRVDMSEPWPESPC